MGDLLQFPSRPCATEDCINKAQDNTPHCRSCTEGIARARRRHPAGTQKERTDG